MPTRRRPRPRARLIILQSEQKLGIHAEARREIYRGRRLIEPVLARSFELAALALSERSRITQTQSRYDPSGRLDPKAPHHTVNVRRISVGKGFHDFPSVIHPAEKR